MRAFTRQDWLDARWYDLCINTSSLGLEKVVEIARTLIMELADARKTGLWQLGRQAAL